MIATSELPAPVRIGGPRGEYVLRHTPLDGWAIWLDVVDPDDGPVSIVCMGDLPASSVDDFETYVDEVEEETRVLLADARVEFGF